ncbi:MAG TPA: YihY/virulence factor BrkB family protein [Chitinophagaceae bacterium]|nr:YihY/virulence factor BrkB family protein [Chitinophagaceae bacterium]
MAAIARKIIGEFFIEFSANKIPKLAAALAYYTIFAFPPLLLIVMRLSDIFYGHEAVEGKVYQELVNLVGKDGALQIQEIIRNTTFSSGGQLAAIVGIVTFLLGATGIFGEIQDSINTIWHLKAKPRKGRGFLRMIINRLLSFSMIAVLGFLLLVTLIANSVMDIFLQRFSARFPQIETVVIYIINLVLSFFIIACLVALIFKVLPDAKIKWRDVRPGVIITTMLFMGGKFLISFYLGRSRLTSTYGAAGSVIITVLWVYYSAIILFIGAIFTRLYIMHKKGSRIYPNDYAVWVENKEITVDKPQMVTTKDV